MTGKLNPVANEPVAVQALAGIVAAIAARYAPGLHLSDAQTLWVALGAYTLLAPYARQLVRPTAKDPTGRDEITVMLHEIVEQTLTAAKAASPAGVPEWATPTEQPPKQEEIL